MVDKITNSIINLENKGSKNSAKVNDSKVKSVIMEAKTLQILK